MHLLICGICYNLMLLNQQMELIMYKRMLLTKPLLNIKFSSWELSNFVSGFVLAKVCGVILIGQSDQESVKSVCAFIFEFGSPVIILIGCAVLQLYFSIRKINENSESESDKVVRRSIELRESIIHALICSAVGFGVYIGFVLVLSQYIISVDQLKIILNGLLPFEFSLAVCMSLIWGNIIKFTTHYKI